MTPEEKKAYMVAYREKHKERLSEQCKAYGKRKYAENREQIRAARKQHYQEHRDEYRAKDKVCRARIKDRIKVRSKRYAARNKEQLATYHHDWWAKNAKRISKKRKQQYQKNRGAHKAKAAAWARSNPEKRLAILGKRRAKKIGSAIGTDRQAYTEFVRSIRNAPNAACYWCGRNVPKQERHIDHIIPLDRGGADDVRNLCCACQSCNCSKGNKLPEEFSGQFVIPFC